MLSFLMRCDATPSIGMGHLMRCLALAQRLVHAGHWVVFLTAGELGTRVLREHGMEAVKLDHVYPDPGDLAVTVRLATKLKTAQTVVVVDGYHFEEAYLAHLQQAGLRVAYIDDYGHLHHYPVDVLINQNLGAERLPYRTPASTIRLLGPQYVLLRDEFLRYKVRQSTASARIRRVLITMGGADPHQVTLLVLEALARVQLADAEFIVLAGAANQHLDQVKERWLAYSFRGRLVVGGTSTAPWMASCDLAISAAGSTVWELAYMGVPALLVATAENQKAIAENLDAAGAALHLGWYEDLDPITIAEALERLAANPSMRARMAERGRQLVDGQGRDRVARVLSNLGVAVL